MNVCQRPGFVSTVRSDLPQPTHGFEESDLGASSSCDSRPVISVRSTVKTYGIPDIDLLKSLYEHTTVRLPERGMGSVKITFDTGVAQGSVLSSYRSGPRKCHLLSSSPFSLMPCPFTFHTLGGRRGFIMAYRGPTRSTTFYSQTT